MCPFRWSEVEELIEVLGVISALSDQDIDHRVTANVDSGSRVHQHLPQSNSLLLSATPGIWFCTSHAVSTLGVFPLIISIAKCGNNSKNFNKFLCFTRYMLWVSRSCFHILS